MTDATIGLVLDCADPDALAAFWSEALGMQNVGVVGNYVVLVSSSGTLPRFLLQRVEEPKSAKNRMHLDIETPHVDEEAGRLEALGARRLEAGMRTEHGFSWMVMADPEGNEFCVCAS
jgi:predicted enzyme related to lactoylglutathione lyase